MSDAERLAAARDEMLPERDRLVAEYEAQREEVRRIGQRIRGMDAQIAAWSASTATSRPSRR
jgi:hypothetical protein